MEEFTLEPGESITLAVRKHWVVFTLELLPFVIVALVPLIILFFSSRLLAMDPSLASGLAGDLSLDNPYLRLGLGLFWLVIWTGAFNTFTRYYLDQWVITTSRIVDIHQFGFFDRHVSSFLLNHVQDVTTDVNGVFPTMFGYGTLRVETAGDASQHFLMGGIPNPEAIRDLILREIALLHDQTGPHP
ncbi:MAG TPA: PH domain-containing protein [Candidatus Paceibacterota bacterium]|nr:PH domain-containing protein [Candidatus Paceibacterota bacterium]